MGTPNRSIGIRLASVAAGAPYGQLLRGTVTPILTPKVYCVSVSLVTAVQTDLLLVKSATLGTASTTKYVNRLVYLGAGDIQNGKVASAWSVPPTIGGVEYALGRQTLPAQVGSTVTWEFSDGALELGVGESLLLWNAGSGAGADIDATFIYEGN